MFSFDFRVSVPVRLLSIKAKFFQFKFINVSNQVLSVHVYAFNLHTIEEG